jgi:hypothetical protein
MAINLAQGNKGLAYYAPQPQYEEGDRWHQKAWKWLTAGMGEDGYGAWMSDDELRQLAARTGQIGGQRITPNNPLYALVQDPATIGMPPEDIARYYRGKRITEGRIATLPLKDRQAAIQFAAEEYRPEGVTPESAAQFAQQYYGSVDLESAMTAPELMQSNIAEEALLTGRGPEYYQSVSEQMGYLPSQWVETRQDLIDQGVTPFQLQQGLEIAGRWSPAQRLGVSRGTIAQAAIGGRLPVVSSRALNAAIGQIGQIAPVPGFGGMSSAAWGSSLRGAQTQLDQAFATGDFTGGWGLDTMWGIQDAMTAENTAYAQAQAAMQIQQINAQRGYLWGSGTPTSPGPQSLWGMQDQSRQFGYVQRMGGTSPFTGRQYTGSFGWAAASAGLSLANTIESADLSLAHTQESAAMSLAHTRRSAGLSLSHTLAGAGLSLGHQVESIDLSREMYMARYGFQQEDLADQFEDLERQQGRAETRYQWQVADWNKQVGRSSIEFGWRMEDYDESIRRATGYQREQLMRNRERDVVRRGWETTDLQDEKDRMEQRREWEKEDFELKKEHLDELKERNEELHQLRLEQFEMREEHAKENHALRVSQAQESHDLRIELAQEQHDIRVRQAQESHDLRVEQAKASHGLRMAQLEEQKAAYEEEYKQQQEITKLQREHQAEQLDFQEEQARLSSQHAAAMRELQERYTNVQRALSTMATDFNDEIIEGLLELLREAERIKNQPPDYNTPNHPGGLPY